MPDQLLYQLVKWCKSLPLFKNILVIHTLSLEVLNLHGKIYHCKGFQGHLGALEIVIRLIFFSPEFTIIKAVTSTTKTLKYFTEWMLAGRFLRLTILNVNFLRTWRVHNLLQRKNKHNTNMENYQYIYTLTLARAKFINGLRFNLILFTLRPKWIKKSSFQG